MANRDFNRFEIQLNVGTTLSADNNVIRGTGFCPVRAQVVGCHLVAEAAFTASSGNHNLFTVKYVDTDGASGSICTFKPDTAAASGMGNLTAGIDKANGDTGVTLTAGVIIPALSTIKNTITKVGDGEPLTRVTVSLICEPMTA